VRRGIFWNVAGTEVGWEGEPYKELRKLAEKISLLPEFNGQIDIENAFDVVCEWFLAPIRGTPVAPFFPHVKTVLEQSVESFEIWVPIAHAFSSEDFAIGDVEFKTITRELLDSWLGRLSPPEMDQQVKAQYNQRTRQKLQASLAACVKLTADSATAHRVALEKATEATALLRFLCVVNSSPYSRSYVAPSGLSAQRSWTGLRFKNDVISSISEKAVGKGPGAWHISEARKFMPGLLESLSDLASNRSTPFRKDVYDAFQLYSRNSISDDLADRLLYFTVALESILVPRSEGSIQALLAERVAFLTGTDPKERLEIAKLIKKGYALRSKFVHAGRKVEDMEIAENFFDRAWHTMAVLLNLRDAYPTKEALIESLELRKYQ
jgi:hypothetical protein